MTRHLLLAGAGHAHAQVLLDWALAPLPGVELTLVSPHADAPYSGMVPGWLAGSYRYEEITIPFARLCAAAGARFVADELAALDPQAQAVTLASGAALHYDLLSINVGSTLTPPRDLGMPVLALRPLAELQRGWDALLQRWQADPRREPAHLTMVGGGAAGVESMLAALARLRALQPQRTLHGRLVAAGDRLLEGQSAAVARRATRALQRAGVAVMLGTEFTPELAAGSDLLLWATGAQSHAWQGDAARRGGLVVDARGFIRIDTQLRSVSHPTVLAAGDCAGWQPPLPKAGVYAVRQAPLLSHNLRALLGGGGALRSYTPQRRHLLLLGTADGSAIGAKGPFTAEGRWLWRWKDTIDRHFVARYRTT
jgi:pyridine nucleotide-disulfide oxidoreductase family protein